jgi:hypothetical protein
MNQLRGTDDEVPNVTEEALEQSCSRSSTSAGSSVHDHGFSSRCQRHVKLTPLSAGEF